MKKVVIKIWSLILVVCAILLVCSCGKTETKESIDTTETITEKTTEIETETEPSTTEVSTKTNSKKTTKKDYETDEAMRITEIVEVTRIVEVVEPNQEVLSSGLVFVLNEDGESCSVAQCYPVVSGKVVIPSTYAGKPVTKIGDFAFEKCSNITEIVIPNSVTSIGVGAFNNTIGFNKQFGYLTHIEIPTSVTHIGTDAIPATVKEITYGEKIYTEEDEIEFETIFGNINVWNLPLKVEIGVTSPPTTLPQ